MRVVLMLAIGIALLAAKPADAQQVPETKKRIFAPKPRYPTDEHGRHPTGRGVFVLEVDTKTGRVISAKIEKSTGHKILDDAAVECFVKWHFKPGVAPKVTVPMEFNHSPNVP